MRNMLLLMSICASVMAAQSKTSFEVASIRPTDPSERTVFVKGGPGSQDPTNLRMVGLTLPSLITTAYGVAYYQLTPLPWMGRDRFNITAKLPEGATKDDMKLMMRALLIERFKLAVHEDQKEMAVFDLVVGKNGPKFKKSAEEAIEVKETTGPSGPLKTDKAGYPILPKGMSMAMTGHFGALQGERETMEFLAKHLSNQLRTPVNDSTGLEGRYDFLLTWDLSQTAQGVTTTPADDAGPTLEQAVAEQLGLKLVRKKAMVQMIVVDRCEKVPTEN